MFIGHFVKRSHLFYPILHNSQIPLTSHGSRNANLISLPIFSKFLNLIIRSKSSCSVTASESETSFHCNHERSYQVVVAATREMGIGKNGKLPWNLTSDLRFFKLLTMNTSVEAKKNAVIMGRKTWESIAPKFRPLPGRLNVVLSRAGMVEVSSTKDLIVCNSLSSALKLMAKPPYYLSIEKVFVIGGGQILKEALNGPGCEAIHLTEVEANVECDTFIPRIDLSMFSPLFSSIKMVENNVQFCFITYVRNLHQAELDYVKQIQLNIAGGNVVQ
ncbi:bifunctional dihydrofolate reductase-thymidylate synthase 1-like [Amaranthus tricolor]|uniref:bifunctional dihydrofolate reductase-thymidylate synthase 1-like n=1 Tax=Amaranthus tricolor TaxID=29722 RepID=UPI0025848EB0|nr:bifunctional dihydrofolate reductase-thymidylate synthase 1-like [Amaranthus tricolor]